MGVGDYVERFMEETRMVELNWEEINKKLQSVTFSAIGCTFPEELDENVKEVLDIVLNKTYLDTHAENFIKIYSAIDNNTSDKRLLLTEEQISILENIIKTNKCDEIISRIGDVLWVLKKDFQAVKIAIQAHQNIFERNKDLDGIRQREAAKNACIAFDLMMELRQTEDAIHFITSIIDDAIEKKEDFLCNYFLDHVIQKDSFKKMSEDKKKNYKNYLKEKANDYASAELCGNLLIRIAQKENDISAQKEAYILIAKGWEKIGEIYGDVNIRCADAMSKAATNYKKGGDDEAANRCILNANKAVQDQSEWTSHSYSIDLKPVFDVYEPEFNDANNVVEKIILITNFTKIKYEDILVQHNNNKKENMFYGDIRKQSIDEKGVVRSSLEGIDPNNEQSEEPYLIEVATHLIGPLSYLIYIFNKKYVLSEVHQVTFSEIIKSLLPKNELMIDYILQKVLSNHPELVIESLLVSFESFLAALLEMNNISSIKQMNDGNVQEDLTMGSLVDECKKHELIDKDDIFIIEALLCNKHGLNLRNTSSHRLTPDAQRVSTVYLFCGYFLIRLLMQYGGSSEKLSKDDQEK